MKPTKTIATPMLDKMHAVKPKSQAIGEFLDFMENRQIRLCEWDEVQERYYSVGKSIETILAEYFAIDLKQVEKERMAILAELQKESTT